MKNPDIKYFIGSEVIAHHCYALPESHFRIVTSRKNYMLAKLVLLDEAQAYCKRHKIELPIPNNQ